MNLKTNPVPETFPLNFTQYNEPKPNINLVTNSHIFQHIRF